ncbi:MAG: HAMP domain-containing sensor histidine kinase [Campylobacterota bacterium]|nr:HAMP domain-containing sensor histidine kinase [Campylobacterota bacterium]
MRAEEKATLTKFVTFYHLSTFILLGVIAVLIYQMQYRMTYNLVVSNMQNSASTISSKIINAHMKNLPLDFDDIACKPKGLIYSLYDKQGVLLYGQSDVNIDLNKHDYIMNDSTILIDKNTHGHLGVYYIAMIDTMFQEKIYAIILKVILGFFIAYAFICMIGFYLGKLFMRPIENERKRLDNFIKDTTHELNTPITAIMMCANKEALSNSKNIERIYLSAKRISEIYKDLTYLFLEQNNQKNITKIAIHKIMEQQLEYFTILAHKKNIEVNCTLEETLINMDEEDFKRVFSNLLSNAIKYNNRGGTIDVVLENHQLIIRDTGIGIQQDKLDKIFKRYYRATNNAGGFGMGLHIVLNILKEYSIPINVESKEGIGTTFRLQFKHY